MKQFKHLLMVFAIALLAFSCETDDDIPTPQDNPLTTEQTDSLLNLYGGYWYIDTAYNESGDLMYLSNMQGRKNLFKIEAGDTLWIEEVGASTDKNYLYDIQGDTLWFEPELAADAHRILIIDSLTETRLHYRTQNVGHPDNAPPILDSPITWYEFYK